MKLRLVTALFLMLFVTACGSHSSWQDNPQTHIVRKGETLFSIAWRYGKSTQDIARWNRLGDGSLIYPGQVLKLHGSAASSRRSSPSATTPSRESRPLPSIPSQPSPKWSWPTQGRINVNFGAKPGTGTGVLINGRSGQPIYAAASGRVVYAGSGLIGYGQLIDQIKKGQKIATMGEGPERKPRLHFEIRRNGKPVNPRQYLSAR